jgi:hypothetical protein
MVAFRLAGLEELLDFSTQAGREFFIRIEGQHPRMRAMREGGILLIAVAQPVLMDDARAPALAATCRVASVLPLSITMISAASPATDARQRGRLRSSLHVTMETDRGGTILHR